MLWCKLGLRIGVVGVALAALLGGCGFRPLYGEAGGQGVAASMGSVEVAPIRGRLGVDLYNRLRDRISPYGVEEGAAAYKLTVSLETSPVGLITDRSSQIRRFDLVVTAHYQLVEPVSGAIALKGDAVSAASYNVLENSSFATLSAEQDAQRQAARAVGDQIALELAVYFERINRLGAQDIR